MTNSRYRIPTPIVSNTRFKVTSDTPEIQSWREAPVSEEGMKKALNRVKAPRGLLGYLWMLEAEAGRPGDAPEALDIPRPPSCVPPAKTTPPDPVPTLKVGAGEPDDPLVEEFGLGDPVCPYEKNGAGRGEPCWGVVGRYGDPPGRVSTCTGHAGYLIHGHYVREKPARFQTRLHRPASVQPPREPDRSLESVWDGPEEIQTDPQLAELAGLEE